MIKAQKKAARLLAQTETANKNTHPKYNTCYSVTQYQIYDGGPQNDA